MSKLPNVVIVVGFCMGTLGAAGFSEPREHYAVTLLVVGMILLVFGGFWARTAPRAPGASVRGWDLAAFLSTVERIRDKVAALDDGRSTLAPREIHRRIDELLRDEYFDLTSRNEELIALVGFNSYARAWDNVASAERLLARCWSMITDDFAEEGLSELPLARQHLEQAVAEFGALARR